jgi:hypothetical protein
MFLSICEVSSFRWLKGHQKILNQHQEETNDFLFVIDEQLLSLYSEITVGVSVNFLDIGQDKNSLFNTLWILINSILYWIWSEYNEIFNAKFKMHDTDNIA